VNEFFVEACAHQRHSSHLVEASRRRLAHNIAQKSSRSLSSCPRARRCGAALNCDWTGALECDSEISGSTTKARRRDLTGGV
jgi:hypothetical protein